MKSLRLISLIAALFMMGCHGDGRRFSYSVAFVNEGKEPIFVDDVVLNSDDRPAGAGLCLPGIRATDLSPTHLPNDTVIVSWKVQATGEKGLTNVTIKLPNGFLTGDNPTIVFHINAGLKVVRVAYETDADRIGNVRVLQ